MSTARDVLISLLVVSLTGLAACICNVFWLKPERIRKKLQQQGINGPPPSFFYGNIPDIRRIQSEMVETKAQQGVNNQVSHDYMSYIFPHIKKWRTDYGSVFAFMLGNMVIVYMSDFELVREFCNCKSIEFGRPSYIRNSRGALLGDSILTTKGTTWVHQRKAIAPEFFLDKVKGMADMIVESGISMVKQWEAVTEEAGGVASIRVDEDLKKFSAKVISKVCFGNSYAVGNEIFARVVALQELLSKQVAFLGLPGLRYIPTKSNREAWRLEREIRNSIVKLIKEKKMNTSEEDDLLKVLIKNFSSDSQLVDNCKALFFAGHETTATAAAFTLVLLAHHPEWQKRVHEEVEEICAGQLPNVDMLHKMKALTMVIHETLRLYPPGPVFARETSEEMKFGDFLIPKGVNIWFPLAELHQDPANWGANANEFHPERFANGIFSACKLPKLYMPFGTGIRTCVGQNLAMVELKIVLSIILSKFTFSLSPDYCHQIAFKLVFAPGNGVHLLMKRK